MRSPWVSPVIGWSMILAICVLSYAFVWVVTDKEYFAQSWVWVFLVTALGSVISLFGCALGVWHLSKRTSPLWPSVAGAVNGFLGTLIWAYVAFEVINLEIGLR